MKEAAGMKGAILITTEEVFFEFSVLTPGFLRDAGL